MDNHLLVVTDRNLFKDETISDIDMTQRIFLPSHTIDDKIVHDSISAINQVEIPQYIGGGISVQTQVRSDFWRETTDLDVTLDTFGTITELRTLLEPFFDIINILGYKVEGVRKKSQTYDIKIATPNDEESILIQIPRRNQKNYEKNRARLRRELANSRKKQAEGIEFRVLSPEDLVLHKLLRIVNFKELYNVQVDQKRLEDLRALAQYIRQFRRNLFDRFDNVSPHEIAKYRAHSDSLDIRALSQNGLDAAYFREASRDWTYMRTKDRQAREVLDLLRVSLS